MKSNKNLHLILSVIIIVPIALVYGTSPQKILPQLFDISVTGKDLPNVFRAIMGLYLAMSIFWIIGISRPKFWSAATMANIVFMGGLASGRLVSILIDGMPSVYFLAGFVLELLLALWGVNNLRRFFLKHIDKNEVT
jgi:hypothetical protein